MSSKKDTQVASQGFSAEEQAALKERSKELKAEARMNKDRAEGEKALFEKIAEMEGPDRVLAERFHEIVTSNAPELMPRTWYGMPAYAKDGKVICFFQAALKFKTRYSTLGFSDAANLDEGGLWPTSFALLELTAAEEKRIAALIKKALS